jgi:aminopeptidase
LKTYNLFFFSINLVVVTPLCENLPGPSANKPGDV